MEEDKPAILTKGKDKVNAEKDVTLGGFGGIMIDLIDERISELNF